MKTEQDILRRDLLEQHIHFLSTHRGVRKSSEHLELIYSDKSFFNIAFPLSPEGLETVSPIFNLYLPSWISIDNSKLENWKLSGGITYMSLPYMDQIRNQNKNIEVRKALTLQEMEDFSLVQGKGFSDTEDEFKEWYPWLREKNMKNFGNTSQDFYIAYDTGKPLGVSLSITNYDVAGIYAVTTLPEHRRQGISTSIMKSVMRDFIINDIKTITLQVNTSSYAHNFYKRLGFKDEFECKIYQPATNE